MGKVVAFRLELESPPRDSRTLYEQLIVRKPDLYRILSSLSMRLTPGSRLRRALLRESVPFGFAAFNRRDFDPVFVQFAQDIEYEAPAGAHALGVSGTIHGRDALREVYEDALEHWTWWQITPAWMLDLGDTLAVLGASHVRGRESGLEIAEEWASVYEIRGGLVAHQRDFLSWEEALRAIPVDPNTVPVPLRRRAGGVATIAADVIT